MEDSQKPSKKSSEDSSDPKGPASWKIDLIVSLFAFLAGFLVYLQNPQHPTIAIAAFLVVLAAGIIIVSWPIPKPWYKNCRVIVAGLLVGFAAILVIYTYLTNPQYLNHEPLPFIKITSHASGANITKIQTVQGIASGIPAGSEIWVAVYAHYPTNRYYPQREQITPDRDGNWLMRDINIGNANDLGYKFDIMALLLNESGQKEFRKYFEEINAAGGGWPGMQHLPVGIIAYDNVTVTRI